MEVTHVAEDGDNVIVTWTMTKEEYEILISDAAKEISEAADES